MYEPTSCCYIMSFVFMTTCHDATRLFPYPLFYRKCQSIFDILLGLGIRQRYCWLVLFKLKYRNKAFSRQGKILLIFRIFLNGIVWCFLHASPTRRIRYSVFSSKINGMFITLKHQNKKDYNFLSG